MQQLQCVIPIPATRLVPDPVQKWFENLYQIRYKIGMDQNPGTQFIEKPARTRMRVRRARLEVIRGPDRGLKKDIQSLHMLVGAALDCDLILADPAISRRHEPFPRSRERNHLSP